MGLVKLSKYVYRDGLHSISYSKRTGYITCTCNQFKFYGKCSPALEVKAIIEAGGDKVSLRRVLKPHFLTLAKNFKLELRKYLLKTYGEENGDSSNSTE